MTQAQAIERAVSIPRLTTYLNATTGAPKLESATVLYMWNAKVSSAFLNPLHFCEVVIRNAVCDAIEAAYGSNWPWDNTFRLSLPSPQKPAFNPRVELARVASSFTSTGKVVAELKFVFWQSMFTGRHDGRLWVPHLYNVLPHLPTTGTVQFQRKSIYTELEQVRLLRNRIAHHEPIFTRSLASDLAVVEKLVSYRCPVTAAWMMNHQDVSTLIAAKPA